MMTNDIPDAVLDVIAQLGFSVYQSSDVKWRSYAYFTDGKNIGYIENNRLGGYHLATVNIPCKECGTGFRITDDRYPIEWTRQGFVRAFAVAPQWASARDREAVRKYADMAAFISSRGRFGELVQMR